MGGLDENFTCGKCGKRFRWKPELAGRRVRCACGEPILVPRKVRASTNGDDSDSYDFAPAAPTGAARERRAAGVVVTPAAASMPSPTGAALDYQRVPKSQRTSDGGSIASDEGMTDPPRDLYVPVAFLIGGFLLLVLYAMAEMRAPRFALMFLLPVAGVAMVVKTAVICGLALMASPSMGMSLGLLRTAVLKIAGMIIFTDAGLLWFHTMMVAGGVVREGYVIPFVYIAATAIVLTGMAWYLFNLDTEDAAKLGIPMAVFSQVSNYLMMTLLVALLSALVSAMRAAPRPPVAPAAVPAPASPAGASATSPPTTGPSAAAVAAANQAAAAIAPTLLDREVMRDISTGLLIVEAHDWQRTRFQKDPSADALIERMYRVGAPRVYIDRRGAGSIKPVVAFVELPATDDGQVACLAEYQAYLSEHALTPPRIQQQMRRFLMVPIAR
jgi:hypothetical protein